MTLLRKMTYKQKASYGSSQPCTCKYKHKNVEIENLLVAGCSTPCMVRVCMFVFVCVYHVKNPSNLAH